MAAFCKLTKASGVEPIWVNLDLVIEASRIDSSRTRLVFSGPGSDVYAILVKETPEAIPFPMVER